jgi:hypothetical protein
MDMDIIVMCKNGLFRMPRDIFLKLANHPKVDVGKQ